MLSYTKAAFYRLRKKLAAKDDAGFYSGFFLFSVLIIAGLLRFHKLDERCLFGDEVLTLDMITGSSWRAIWQKVVENCPGDLPLYYIVLHYWGLINQGTFWLRAFSVFTSLISLIIIYKFCVYLFDKKTALLAVFLRAISPIRVLYSQTIRYYSFNSLFNLLSLYFFIKAVHRNTKPRWLLYIFARVISIYINYSSFLFLFFEGIFIWLYDKKYPSSSKRWLVSLLVIMAFCFPVAFYFFRDFGTLLSGEGFSRVPLRGGFIANFFYTFFAFSFGQTISPFNYPVVIIGALIYLCIIASFFKGYFQKTIPREPANFLLLILLIVVGLCSFSNYNSPRYILAAGSIYGIVVALGILGSPRRQAVGLLSAVILLQSYSIYNLYTEQQYHKKEMIDNWDKIASYVKNNSSPQELVIYNVHTFLYYFKASGCRADVIALSESDEDMPSFIKDNLEPHRRSSRIIFVDSPLSGLRIQHYEYEIGSLNNWLKENKFNLSSKKCFDKDRFAQEKRKFMDRPFPECRTTVYVYERNK
jgi:hypothetical protein